MYFFRQSSMSSELPTPRMKTASLVISVFLSVSTLCATAQETADTSHAIQGDVVYGHKAGMALTYDVITPAEANGAAVLFMVSGGWYSRYTPPEMFANFVGYLLDEGFTVIPVRHGSAPWFKVPEAVADVRRAVRHIRMHAQEYGIDPDRLGVMGGSAGGHLSLMLGLASDEGNAEAEAQIEQVSNRVAAVAAYFPPTDLTDMAGPNERFPALEFDPALESDISPIKFVSEDDPPVLLVHGDQDELVRIEHSYRLQEAMNAQELNVELVVIEGARHGFRGEHQARARQAVRDFFVAQLAN